jgi:hypothetical protein
MTNKWTPYLLCWKCMYGNVCREKVDSLNHKSRFWPHACNIVHTTYALKYLKHSLVLSLTLGRIYVVVFIILVGNKFQKVAFCLQKNNETLCHFISHCVHAALTIITMPSSTYTKSFIGSHKHVLFVQCNWKSSQ